MSGDTIQQRTRLYATLRSTLNGETIADYICSICSALLCPAEVNYKPLSNPLCLARLQLTHRHYITTDHLLRFTLSGETTAYYPLYPLRSTMLRYRTYN
jgi:hypothetical protein